MTTLREEVEILLIESQLEETIKQILADDAADDEKEKNS